MSIFLRSALMLLVTIVVLGVTKGQDSESQYWYPVEPFRIEVDRQNPEVRALLERWDRIGNETANITYQKSGYRGWLLRWAPRAGFVYVYHSEGLSIIDFSYGKVETTSSEIRFIPERDMRENYRGHKLSTPLTWVVAQSPQLKFMIPKDEIESFGQYMAGLHDYNDFNGPCCEFDPFFVSTVSAGELVISVSPVVVPDEYERFMKRPITGRIVSIGKRRIVKSYGLSGELYSHYFAESSLTPIAINVGRIHGLRKNMLLRFAGDQFTISQYIRVTSVGRQTAAAVVIRDVDERNQESYIVNPESGQRMSFPPIQPGMEVTTSPILNFIARDATLGTAGDSRRLRLSTKRTGRRSFGAQPLLP